MNTTTDLNENTDASVRIKVADISITDDAQGINNITLSGDDAASFEVDGTVLYLKAGTTLNYEAQSSYAVTVNVDDSTVGGTPDASQSFTLNVTNLDEVAPTITSGATADAVAENSGAGQVVYTATSTDTGDIASGSTTYSLKSGDDAAAFSIDGATGAVTLTGDPDYEGKSSYSFTVIATDAAGHASEQAVSLGINNLDEVAPTITSGATADAVAENSGAGQVVYTATSADTGDIASGSTTYSLKSGDDAAAFSIDGATGAVTLTGDPDYEGKSKLQLHGSCHGCSRPCQ